MAETHKVGKSKKNWREAVVVVGFSVFMSWRHIHLGLSRMLKCRHDLTPLIDDRAIIWSVSEEDEISGEHEALHHSKGW